MSSIQVRIPIRDGQSGINNYLIAEMDTNDALELASSGIDGRLEEASRSLSAALDGIRPALETIITKLQTATRQPKEIQVEFGLKFGGELGLIFTKGTAEASFNVTMTWAPQNPAS
ncbi:CU044_2847 family protein [Microbispora rosea]|uniref:CU044_2847 family protein n=1 Tax=Microbispora rosea TaxID=58117 RepID=UPI003D93282C